jgi:hypothetical protein
MAQGAEHLPSVLQTLGSIPNTEKQKGCKSKLTTNYVKCKGANTQIKGRNWQNGVKTKNKNHDSTIYCLQETHLIFKDTT